MPPALDFQAKGIRGRPVVELNFESAVRPGEQRPGTLATPAPPVGELRECDSPEQCLALDRFGNRLEDLGIPGESALGMSIDECRLTRADPGTYDIHQMFGDAPTVRCSSFQEEPLADRVDRHLQDP